MKFLRVLCLFAFGGGGFLQATHSLHAQDPTPAYLDPQRPIPERIEDLLPRMTLAEKVNQLSDDWGSAAIPRLKIPALLKTEGLHGNSYATGATIFPEPIAMAATWNPGLVARIGKATAVESKAAGIHQSWSPVLDVVRDARWGRIEETYGEDPLLVARMGVAWITGFQGEGMIATPKHFAGHGFPLGGRDSNDIGLSDRVMRESQLVPFRAAFEEARAGAVMAAYGVWEGVPDNASRTLLQSILREEWGFDGIVVTDCGSIESFVTKHAVTDDYETACRLALDAGVNIECGQILKKYLPAAVQDGVVGEALIDEALRPVLAAKFRLGLFDGPAPTKIVWDKLPAYDTPEHRALARQTATESMVLVRNQDHILPLSRKLRTIAVIGPDAADLQTGDYSAKPAPGQLSTVLAAIKTHVGPDTQVLYAPGFDWAKPMDKSGFPTALDIAKRADVVIMVLGDNSGNESEDKHIEATTGENRDGATLVLPGAQEELVRAIAAVGKPVVLDVVNGKPFVLSWEDENVAAILISWYGGEEAGNATADLLFGDENPSGKLPITFPRHAGQEPLTYDYKTSGRRYDYYDISSLPLYRFGFGLSYTTFQYSNLQITQNPSDPGLVDIAADVSSTGAVPGDEVAQLYLTDLVASVTTPIIQLKGFQRLSLNPGETKRATFHLTPYDLSLLDEKMARVVEPGVFHVHVGGSSPQPALSGRSVATDEQKQRICFSDPSQGITGEFREPKAYAARFVYSLQAPEHTCAGEETVVALTVRNEGNLTDVTQVKLYEGQEIGDHHFELAPGETKTQTLRVPLYAAGAQVLSAVGSGQAVSLPITVERAPAKLQLSPPKIQVGEDGTVRLTTMAASTGSDPFEGNIDLGVDGRKTGSMALKLAPGEHQALTLSFQAEHGGSQRVQLGDLPAFDVNVPGGLGMAWGRGAALYMPLDEKSGRSAKDAVSGRALAIDGAAQWQDDGLLFKDGAQIQVGDIDLANRSFTLAAWVNVTALGEERSAGFFGGNAPMGAGLDSSGSVLHAGIRSGKLLSGFFGRDVSSQNEFPVGKWVHVAFAYDHSVGRGTIYRDGSVDVRDSQKPFEGRLNTIGTTPMMHGGQFSLHDVIVLNGSLDDTAAKVLALGGPAALKSGRYQSEWRPADGKVPSQFTALARVPAGSSVLVTIETGDAAGGVISQQAVELTADRPVYSLAGLKPGGQIRVTVDLKAERWDLSPELKSIVLKGTSMDLRWITSSQWKKGVATGGVQITE